MLIYIDRFNMREEYRQIEATKGLEEIFEDDIIDKQELPNDLDGLISEDEDDGEDEMNKRPNDD